MTHHGKFVFIQQHGQTGYNATVTLRIESAPHQKQANNVGVEIAGTCEPRFAVAIKFGILYALGQLGLDPQRVCVAVEAFSEQKGSIP